MSEITISPSFAPASEINFCFPVPERLETERVALVPFDPSKHAEAAYNGTKGNSDDVNGSWAWVPMGPFESLEDFLQFVTAKFHLQDSTLFAILDKTKGEVLAGLIGCLYGSANDLSVELGPVIVFPAFQKTFVASNAVGILLHYALDLPVDGGLGLRRVQWFANVMNTSSVRAAERMGFQREGIIRWARVLTPQKSIGTNGKAIREGDPRGSDHSGRDSIVLSLCWDDWESQGRALTDAAIERLK
ncbi:acyl-CoA N-acyltransferase [Mycena floridula]|nr:acyl-CoA N-acyltransferase [Mycena floridula]